MLGVSVLMHDVSTDEFMTAAGGGQLQAESRTTRPSRRSVAAGLAWAVPVVTLGAAAPAMAASGCPTMTYVLDDSHSGYDEVRITNTGTVALPVGTTITWVVQNRAGIAATLAFISGGLSGVSASVSSIGITAGGTATITFTLTAALAPGASLYWRYTITGWNYATRITVNGCVGATACRSSYYYTPGTACPTGGGGGARLAGPPTFPDPSEVPPKTVPLTP